MENMAEENPKKQTKGKVLMEYAQAILLAVILAMIIRSFVLQAFQIPSGSMIPTFLEGDRVLVSKFAYGLRNPFNNNLWLEIGHPERWDVAVFIYPIEPDKDFVKRIVGLPGETVAMQSGKLYINGTQIDDSHANYDPAAFPRGQDFPETKVPEGHYFVMGDNRDHSSDSRSWGMVDEKFLKGKAWRLYWSWDSSDDPEIALTDRLRASRIGTKIN